MSSAKQSPSCAVTLGDNPNANGAAPRPAYVSVCPGRAPDQQKHVDGAPSLEAVRAHERAIKARMAAYAFAASDAVKAAAGEAQEGMVYEAALRFELLALLDAAQLIEARLATARASRLKRLTLVKGDCDGAPEHSADNGELPRLIDTGIPAVMAAP